MFHRWTSGDCDKTSAIFPVSRRVDLSNYLGGPDLREECPIDISFGVFSIKSIKILCKKQLHVMCTHQKKNFTCCANSANIKMM